MSSCGTATDAATIGVLATLGTLMGVTAAFTVAVAVLTVVNAHRAKRFHWDDAHFDDVEAAGGDAGSTCHVCSPLADDDELYYCSETRAAEGDNGGQEELEDLYEVMPTVYPDVFPTIQEEDEERSQSQSQLELPRLSLSSSVLTCEASASSRRTSGSACTCSQRSLATSAPSSMAPRPSSARHLRPPPARRVSIASPGMIGAMRAAANRSRSGSQMSTRSLSDEPRERSDSQELVYQLQKFLFTNEEVSLFSERAKERQQQATPSISPDPRRRKSLAGNELMESIKRFSLTPSRLYTSRESTDFPSR